MKNLRRLPEPSKITDPVLKSYIHELLRALRFNDEDQLNSGDIVDFDEAVEALDHLSGLYYIGPTETWNIPVYKQMVVFGGILDIDGVLNVDGQLYIEP